MLPKLPQLPGQPSPMPSPQAPAMPPGAPPPMPAQGPGGPDLKSMLVKSLSVAMKLAKSEGVSFRDLIEEALAEVQAGGQPGPPAP